jgi:hypothetical protein
MEHWELAAREAIRDLVARYNANGDSGRFGHVLALFAPDAVMDIGEDTTYTGHAEIRTIFTGVRDNVTGAGPSPTYVRHLTSTHQIDLIDRSNANGRCYFTVLTTVGLDHWGRYIDRYAVVDGDWRFAHRRVVTDGYSPDSLFR